MVKKAGGASPADTASFLDAPSKQRDDLNLLNMIESRIMEIIQIEDECKKKLPKLYYQRLPRFMRRRAACHNPKRLPKKLRPTKATDFGSKSRVSLLKYRRRTRFQKHKRILVKHARHKYKDPNKSLLHKWFAKRFKMGPQEPLLHVPLHNNTKNQRNLYRQSRSGCAYIALGHLSPIKLTFELDKDDLFSAHRHLEALNMVCREISGFTFIARSLTGGRYELVIHLFDPHRQSKTYTCPALVNLSYNNDDDKSYMCLTLWVPKENLSDVNQHLELVSEESSKKFSIERIFPRRWFRVRLLGPSAYKEALRIAENKEAHLDAIKDTENRLTEDMGSTIGRFLEENTANFTYYNTVPRTVDVVFKNSEGRLLWHRLVKNKAHLVGGYRDIERLFTERCFQIKPDYV